MVFSGNASQYYINLKHGSMINSMRPNFKTKKPFEYDKDNDAHDTPLFIQEGNEDHFDPNSEGATQLFKSQNDKTRVLTY